MPLTGLQLIDHALGQLRIKHVGEFGDTAQRSGCDAEASYGPFAAAGLDQATHRVDDGVEQEDQDQGRVLVEVKGAIVCLVAIAPVVVEALQEGQDGVEVLRAVAGGSRRMRWGNCESSRTWR